MNRRFRGIFVGALVAVSIALVGFVGTRVVTRMGERQGDKEWEDFVRWRKTQGFTDLTNTILTIDREAKQRGDVSSSALPTLIDLMGSTQAMARVLALSVAQKATSETAKSSLRPKAVELLGDRDPDVRLEAVYTLRIVGTPEVVSALDRLRSDPDPQVAREARRTIEKLSEKK